MDTPIKGELSVAVGKKSVDKLTDAIVDVFSPGTELLGALGDAVRLGRVEMAARTVRRAGEIAAANGMNLKAPPLKFLVPFFEKASIEGSDDTELQELWAQLLVSASSKFTGQHLIYANILSILDSVNASLFDAIFSHTRNVTTQRGLFLKCAIAKAEFSEKAMRTIYQYDDPTDIDGMLADIGSLMVKHNIIVTQVSRSCSDPGSRFYVHGGYTFNAISKAFDPKPIVDEYSMHHLANLQTLESLGLIVEKEFDKTNSDGISTNMTWYETTILGIHFWMSCNGFEIVL